MLSRITANITKAANHIKGHATSFSSKVNFVKFEEMLLKEKTLPESSPNAAQGAWQAYGQMRAARIAGRYTVLTTGVLGAGFAYYQRVLSKQEQQVIDTKKENAANQAALRIKKQELESISKQLVFKERQLEEKDEILASKEIQLEEKETKFAEKEGEFFTTLNSLQEHKQATQVAISALENKEKMVHAYDKYVHETQGILKDFCTKQPEDKRCLEYHKALTAISTWKK